ncbi:MAG TPA: DUF3341 domain-containing protein [Calditrichia bacterium]|nr:DUF3341 domain-containing protein [Calditrichota bacterium]HQU70845.1 DUF3341 domain-containing protein [Calditrichia bacterium]HQV33453.1 DUF3341 domain-containing protein [Calditrichia bacterium]
MEFRFRNKAEFMDKLEDLFKSGVSPDQTKIVMPHPDHDIEHLVEEYTSPSPLKFFTLIGGLTGCFTGFFIAVWTTLDWQLVTGGKPMWSLPAYVVIGFELTILLGALSSVAGLFLMGRLPRFSKMTKPEDYGNEFVIIIDED